MDVDVIIAGAGFAGLAVASRLRSGQRVLLLDRQPIGEGQTSACAAPLITLERMGARDAVVQVHEELVIHTPRGAAVWHTGVPFATFDYRTFSRAILDRLDVDMRVAAVHGLRDGAVLTDAGEFRAPLRHYAALLGFQVGLLHLAPWLLGPASQVMTHARPLRVFFDRYMEIFGFPEFLRRPAAGPRRLVDANAV